MVASCSNTISPPCSLWSIKCSSLSQESIKWRPVPVLESGQADPYPTQLKVEHWGVKFSKWCSDCASCTPYSVPNSLLMILSARASRVDNSRHKFYSREARTTKIRLCTVYYLVVESGLVSSAPLTPCWWSLPHIPTVKCWTFGRCVRLPIGGGRFEENAPSPPPWHQTGGCRWTLRGGLGGSLAGFTE